MNTQMTCSFGAVPAPAARHGAPHFAQSDGQWRRVGWRTGTERRARCGADRRRRRRRCLLLLLRAVVVGVGLDVRRRRRLAAVDAGAQRRRRQPVPSVERRQETGPIFTWNCNVLSLFGVPPLENDWPTELENRLTRVT